MRTQTFVLQVDKKNEWDACFTAFDLNKAMSAVDPKDLLDDIVGTILIAEVPWKRRCVTTQIEGTVCSNGPPILTRRRKRSIGSCQCGRSRAAGC